MPLLHVQTFAWHSRPTGWNPALHFSQTWALLELHSGDPARGGVPFVQVHEFAKQRSPDLCRPAMQVWQAWLRCIKHAVPVFGDPKEHSHTLAAQRSPSAWKEREHEAQICAPSALQAAVPCFAARPLSQEHVFGAHVESAVRCHPASHARHTSSAGAWHFSVPLSTGAPLAHVQ